MLCLKLFMFLFLQVFLHLSIKWPKITECSAHKGMHTPVVPCMSLNSGFNLSCKDPRTITLSHDWLQMTAKIPGLLFIWHDHVSHIQIISRCGFASEEESFSEKNSLFNTAVPITAVVNVTTTPRCMWEMRLMGRSSVQLPSECCSLCGHRVLCSPGNL